MRLSSLGRLLSGTPQFGALRQSLQRHATHDKAIVPEQAVAFALAQLWHESDAPMVVVAPLPEHARRLYEQMQVWGGESCALHFPETETLPFERLASDDGTIQQRLATLAAMRAGGIGSRPPAVVASASAAAQKTLDRDSFEQNSHDLTVRESVDLDETLDLWSRIGYLFESSVVGPGQFSRRGGIIDIFPVGADAPARIELWGNEIDTIREFDPATQRSTRAVESVRIIPARETLPSLTPRELLDARLGRIDVSNCTPASAERLQDEFNALLDGYDVEELEFYAGFFNHGSLFEYLPDDSLLVLVRPARVAGAAWDVEERTEHLREAKEGRGELPRLFPSSHFAWREVEERVARFARRLDVEPSATGERDEAASHVLPFGEAPSYYGKLEDFVEDVDGFAASGRRVVAVTSHSRRLGEILDGYGVAAEVGADLDKDHPPGSVSVLQAEGAGLQEGFTLSAASGELVVFSDAEVFGVAKRRSSARRNTMRRAAFLSELSPGDYVVHVEHGIGRFVGTGNGPRGQEGEFLTLQYAQGDKLYVPMEHLDRVGPYVAPLDRPPSLTRLGTQEWRRAKARAERSTREMASELLALYASRELSEGYAFAPDTHWQAELEESFPFEETPDQLSTIAEVKTDMESARPMDRLICGDVGYGKTEIALRAAFKAVMEGMQVAILVPTTVLAQQHYMTFTQRLGAYPVRIEALSRFRTDREQRDIVRRLAEGEVDICVGTHRLLQKDVRFKNLGLVVVDEEQRFGVAHKERLKQMREQVDVLTMTATPIPRTLHMSLAGVRDMSTIETPPEERLPIKTYVSEFSEDLVREAILRELDRQGQVYFLHNRVYNIDYMAGYVRRLVPEAEVGVAHGQMAEGQLESTMLDFAEGKMDVLVCTTIIESGLDIQNVNTLIINRADAFGLAQLYQLRGRVGRGSRRAYSYLLVPRARSLTEAADKRLRAMLAASELSAGFRIAMKDLEIRGAGNILGAEQSGHIHAIGFNLYTQLLSIAVEELRATGGAGRNGSGDAEVEQIGRESGPFATAQAPQQGPKLDLGIPVGLPDDYVEYLPARIDLYHRLASLARLEDVSDVEEELRDRFGPLPWQAQNLLYATRLRISAREAGVVAITRQDDRVVIQLGDSVGGARPALQRAVGRAVEVGDTQLRMSVDGAASGWETALAEAVGRLAEFRTRLISELASVG